MDDQQVAHSLHAALVCKEQFCNEKLLKNRKAAVLDIRFLHQYSKVSNKRTVFNKRTGGDIILQKG